LVTKGAEILRVVEEGLEKMKKGDGSGVVDR
jgi:hypothetical protein